MPTPSLVSCGAGRCHATAHGRRRAVVLFLVIHRVTRKMPCDGAWPQTQAQAQVETVQRWIDEGKPA
jgi:hypothetical protein